MSCTYCSGVLTVRASTDSSSDSDSVTRYRTTLANVLNRGNRLPADVIPKIVDYWAHVGWYAIEKDEREYMYSDSELDEEGSFGS